MDLVRTGLGVDDLHIEIAALAERARVEQIEWRLVTAAPRILCHERIVRKCALRILVEVAQQAVGRRRVEIEVILLHVLAAVALHARQPEGALFQDRVAAVP
ncbi:MAG: hypothetical protein ACXWU0_08290 [Rhodoplanes sp.]